ncbi:hypothetical protein chiPu_0020899, partial [Chiloscyllium punctatum]|nr:hypothetical protein [Chiloscyllium punctatum]
SAITNKIKWYMSKKKEGGKEHWLDWADQKYEKEIINDAKRLYNVLALYPLLPMYWALYEQQGSRWTLQAQEMDRNVGSIKLKPDQLQLFDTVPHNELTSKELTEPVTRMSIGMIGAAVAFCITGIVQVQIQKWQVSPPPNGMTGLKIFNGAPCQFSIDFFKNHITMDPQTFSDSYLVPVDTFMFHIVPVNCTVPQRPLDINVTMDSETSSTLFMIPDNSVKVLDNSALVRIFPVLEIPDTSSNKSLRLTCEPDAGKDLEVRPFDPSLYTPVRPGRCSLQLSGVGPSFLHVEGEVELKDGGVYTIAVYQANHTDNNEIILTGNKIASHLTLQAPSSMRSVVMAVWLLTIGVGNLIVVLIAEIAIIKDQAVEFFVFALLMALISLIFIITARFYKYHPIDTKGDYHHEADKETESDSLSSEVKAPPSYTGEENKPQANR